MLFVGATSPRFSRTGGGALDAPKTGALCQPFNPISERVDSRVVNAYARLSFYFFLQKNKKNNRWTVKEGREPSPGPPSVSLGSFTSPWCVFVYFYSKIDIIISARSPVPVRESRPGSLSLAGATPSKYYPLRNNIRGRASVPY